MQYRHCMKWTPLFMEEINYWERVIKISGRPEILSFIKLQGANMRELGRLVSHFYEK